MLLLISTKQVAFIRKMIVRHCLTICADHTTQTWTQKALRRIKNGIRTEHTATTPTLLWSQRTGFVGICIKADISSSFICGYKLHHLSASANANIPCCRRLKSHRWSTVMYDNMQNHSHISVVWSQQWRRRRQQRQETAQVSLLNRKSLPPLWGETADQNSFLGTHAAPL